MDKMDELRGRAAPMEISPDEFRKLGYMMVDQVADFLDSLPKRPVNPGETPPEVRAALGGGGLPEKGAPAEQILKEAAQLVFDHSLFNGHPRFWGYVTSSAAPIGALADMLAAAVNPNIGGWFIGPMGSEIESQVVRWIAEMLGFPAGSGGLLVSGGNTANFVGFLAARKAKTGWDVRTKGMHGKEAQRLRVYVSDQTHTWIQKAADLYGLGTDAIRWIPSDDEMRIKVNLLQKQIEEDKGNGDFPFLVVGSAGTVGTGTVDPLPDLAEISKEHDLWFHVDGAYGGFAAVVPDLLPDIYGLSQADSIAIDPHKWLYTPLEAGCTIVREPITLLDAFSYRPEYYKFDAVDGEEPISYYEYGPQNSRGFRALKVWLGLRQVGRQGYEKMISNDIALAKILYGLADAHPELEAFTQSLSISTFRYVPLDLQTKKDEAEEYLNELNNELLGFLQNSGEAYVSNAVIKGKYVLRACVVNFRTALEDIEALPEIVTRLGKEVDDKRRPEE